MRSRTGRPVAVRRSLVVSAVTIALLAGGTATAGDGTAATPPPTPVPPSGSPSPFPTALHTPAATAVPPKLTSPSAILLDLDTGQVLYAKKANLRRPIASVTKVMTALVVLEETAPEDVVRVSARAAGTRASQLGLVTGERISVGQLLYALLMQSANDAAVALAEHVAGSVESFVDAMNRKAAELGLRRTLFRDPSGLDDGGYSTARDVAAIVRAAYEKPLFARITRTKFRRIAAPSGPARRIQNRNILLWLYPGAIGAKTGFTTPAQHCLVAAADRGGIKMIAVALGSGGDDAGGVFDDGAALLNFGYEAFLKTILVSKGQSLGRITVEGQPVRVVSATALVRYVRRDRLTSVARTFVPDSGLALPVVAGQRVGRQVVAIAGKRAGTVEAVAAETVFRPVPRATPRPTDLARSGSLAVVLRFLAAFIRSLLEAFL